MEAFNRRRHQINIRYDLVVRAGLMCCTTLVNTLHRYDGLSARVILVYRLMRHISGCPRRPI